MDENISRRLEPFEFFFQEAPSSLSNAKFFCTNASGTVVYGVNLKVKSVFDLVTGSMTHLRETAEICTFELISGRSRSYRIDSSLTLLDIRTALDVYLLHDNLVILVCYDRQTNELYQHAIFLSKATKTATVHHTKKRAFSDITYDITLCLGSLPNQIAVIGTKGAFDGEREVVAYLVAANPAMEENFPVEQITEKINKFLSFLKVRYPEYSIFPSGIFFDREGIYFLVKEMNSNTIVTDVVGKLLYEKDGDYIQVINHGQRMLFHGLLRTSHLMYTLQRGRHLWMVMDPPNYEKMLGWRWRLYFWWMPYLIRIMIEVMRFTVWLRRLDNGWSLNMYIRLLTWWYGPTATPQLEADPILLLYYLDLRTLMLHSISADVPVSVAHNILPFFNIGCDTDSLGGMTLAELPDKSSTAIKFKYFHCPSKPPTLCRLASHRCYRLFPAFEKSNRVRRMLGQTEFF